MHSSFAFFSYVAIAFEDYNDDFEETLRSIAFTNQRNQVRQCKLEIRHKTYREK